MVKINLLLSLIGVCSLCTSVFGEITETNECEIFEDVLRSQYSDDNDDSYVSVEGCSKTDDGKMTALSLKGEKLKQVTIDEISKYEFITKLTFYRIHEFEENISFESLNLTSIGFNNLKYGRKIYKFSDKYIQTGMLKTMKNVEEIHIRANKVSQTTLNEISTLTKLKEFTCYECGYDENLDFSVLKKAKSLNRLALGVYGHEHSIPDSIKTLCKLKNLKRLEIDCLQLTTIPNCIGNLKKLEYLDLSYNSLTDLPSGLGELTRLKELYLNDNELTSIPSFLSNLSKLEKINLSYNRENAKFPSALCELNKLQNLVIESNAITKLPSCIENLRKLTDLNVCGNDITKIPSSIKYLKNIKSLDISFNELTEIPSSLSKLKNLEELNLRHNKINGTIPESFNNLQNLKSINLEGNINIKGKSLTNPKLEVCIYTDSNEVTEFCIDKNSKCIPTNKNIPQC